LGGRGEGWRGEQERERERDDWSTLECDVGGQLRGGRKREREIKGTRNGRRTSDTIGSIASGSEKQTMVVRPD
jgi:hypothetical protein